MKAIITKNRASARIDTTRITKTAVMSLVLLGWTIKWEITK